MSKEWIKECQLTLVDNLDKLNQLKNELALCSYYALDFETSGLDFFTDTITGISISPKTNVGYYIPIDHLNSNNLDLNVVRETLNPVMEGKKALYFNAAFDRVFLQKYGIHDPHDFEDIMLLIYHFNTEKYRRISLKKASKELLEREMIEFEDLFSDEDKKRVNKKKPQLRINHKTAEHCVQYACSDSINTLLLYEKCRSNLPSRLELVYKLDTEYIDYIIDITKSGYSIDIAYLTNLRERIQLLVNQLEKELNEEAKMPINVDASASVWAGLQNIGISPTTFTTTGKPSFDEKTLLALDHPFARKCLKVKGLKKMISTFIDSLLEGIHRVTGRCHSNYTYTHTSTGRLSATKYAKEYGVNIQQAAKFIVDPKDELAQYFANDSMRKGIVPPKGYFHAKFDIAGAELRIAAHFSRERVWLDGFAKGEDLHQKLANEMNRRIPGLNISRQNAKNAQFNLLYAFYWSTFARNNGISMENAETIYKAFFETVHGYNAWREYYRKLSQKQGYSETYYGRRRVIDSYTKAITIHKTIPRNVPFYDLTPDLQDRCKKVRMLMSQGDRESINHRIQGTCLDILKIAGSRLRKYFIATGQWETDVIPLMTLHDEYNFAIKGELKEIRDEKGDLIRYECDEKAMEILKVIKKFICMRPDKFILDIDSDCGIGHNWKELKKISL